MPPLPILRGGDAETFGEWSSPINVGPPVNTEYTNMYAILLAGRIDDVLHLGSSRMVLEEMTCGLRHAHRSMIRGETPQNMSALNTSAPDSLAVLSSDEHVMFFHSTRPGGCGAGDIWMTRRHNRRSQEWDPPINLGCVVNTTATEIAPAFFENPETGQVTLFYGSNRPGSQVFDVYASACRRRRVLWAGSAGAGIQQPRARHAHFHEERWPGGVHHIRPHGRTGAYRHLDVNAGNLSRPVADAVDVPSPVNSACDDGSPWLSRDGTTLYFFSNRADVGCGTRDIWYTTREKIKQEQRHSGASRVSGSGCLRMWR